MNNRFGYAKDHAGFYPTGGAIKGAEIITPKRPALWRQITDQLEAEGVRGLTGDEIAAKLGWERFRVRPRTAELRKMGKIVDSGQRRPSESGIRSIVWTLP